MGVVPPAKIPLAGNVISIILQMTTFSALSICLVRRVPTTQSLKRLPLATWLVLIIYLDSALFVFATAIVTRGIGINTSRGVCDGGILLCLVCYMTTKILIYYFLVEKAYIVRGSHYPRLKTKLWLFNFFGMIIPYCIVVVLNFVFRIAYINPEGVCIIGMQKISMLPLITFDVVVNVYLTTLFILPLRQLYSYKNNTNTSLRTIAKRSLAGSCATLTSSVVNLTVLMVLEGEPAWICLMLCNADVLFSVLVLHWVTQVDRNSGASTAGSHVRSNPALKYARREGDALGPRSLGPGAAMGLGHAAGPASVTTEIVAVGGMGRGGFEDVVELRGIRVQTERRREVEVDVDVEVEGEAEGDRRSEGSAGGYVIERGVCAEKMF